jgi:hypothetical protein
MKRFLLKILVFILPFAILVGGFTLLMVYSGEAMPLSSVVQMQMGDTPVLYRPNFGNRDVQFKTLSVNMRQPEIIAIGSSRVLQMRDGLFTEQPEAFYNAGAPAWGLDEIKTVLQSLDHIPQVVILGIDFPWFNAAYEADEFPAPLNDLEQLGATNRSVLRAVLEGRAPEFDLWAARRDRVGDGMALGGKAIENGHGFRSDGSERYGDFLVAGYLYQPTERERHMEWMRNGEEMYVYGDTVSDDAIGEMTEILEWSKANNITLIGMLPPYAPELYRRMMRRENHTYMEGVKSRLSEMFSEYGYRLFDYSDGAAFGTDEDFFDGWHGSERVYLRLYMQMVEALPEALGRYSNLERLREIDAQAGDTWRVFEY